MMTELNSNKKSTLSEEMEFLNNLLNKDKTPKPVYNPVSPVQFLKRSSTRQILPSISQSTESLTQSCVTQKSIMKRKSFFVQGNSPVNKVNSPINSKSIMSIDEIVEGNQGNSVVDRKNNNNDFQIKIHDRVNLDKMQNTIRKLGEIKNFQSEESLIQKKSDKYLKKKKPKLVVLENGNDSPFPEDNFLESIFKRKKRDSVISTKDLSNRTLLQANLTTSEDISPSKHSPFSSTFYLPSPTHVSQVASPKNMLSRLANSSQGISSPIMMRSPKNLSSPNHALISPLFSPHIRFATNTKS